MNMNLEKTYMKFIQNIEKVIACLSVNCIQKKKYINFYLYRNKKNGFDEKLSLGSPSNVHGFFLFSLKKAVNKVI